jgi:hypothetical protein
MEENGGSLAESANITIAVEQSDATQYISCATESQLNIQLFIGAGVRLMIT